MKVFLQQKALLVPRILEKRLFEKKAFLVIIYCSNKVSMKQFFKNAHHDNAKAYFISLCKLSEAINVKV